MAKEKTFEEQVLAQGVKRDVTRESMRRYRGTTQYVKDLVAKATDRRIASIVNASRVIDDASRHYLASAGFDASPVVKTQRVEAPVESPELDESATA
jgi:uncharacterized protein YciW